MRRTLSACGLAALIAALLAGGRAARAVLPEGAPAPDFEVRTTHGETVRLSKLRGRVALLEFWATWSDACLQGIPHLQALHKKYERRGLRVIGISVGEGLAKPRDHFGTNPQVYPIGHTDRAEGRALSRKYAFTGVPTTCVIDRKGIIRFAETGSGRDDRSRKRQFEKIDRLVRKLLAEK